MPSFCCAYPPRYCSIRPAEKTIESGSNRGVGGKEIANTGRGERYFKRMRGLLHEIAGALQHREGRMSLIQVTDLRLYPERPQQTPSPDPEQQFLLEAQLRAAAIQFARDGAMSGDVRGVIAVQQVELHSADLDLPGAQPNRISRQWDLQAQPLAVRLTQRRDRQLSRVVVRVEGLLRSIFVDHLAKIALLIEQPYAHHRHAQVAGGFQLIASHIAQAPGVNGQGLAQHKLHAEIGAACQSSVRMILLKPCGRLGCLPAGFQQSVDLLSESWIG